MPAIDLVAKAKETTVIRRKESRVILMRTLEHLKILSLRRKKMIMSQLLNRNRNPIISNQHQQVQQINQILSVYPAHKKLNPLKKYNNNKNLVLASSNNQQETYLNIISKKIVTSKTITKSHWLTNHHLKDNN